MRTLVHICLLLLLPVLGLAQDFEIGINGGASFHSLPMGNSYTRDDKPTVSYVLSGKVDLKLPSAQIGIGLEMLDLDEYNFLIPKYTTRQYNHIAKPLITPFAFFNKLHELDNGYIYAGLMFGPAIAKVGVNQWEYNGPFGAISGYSTTYNSAIGYVAGIQAGATVGITDRLSLNLELALRYSSFTYTDPNSKQTDNPYRYHVVYYPLTLGLKYRI